jgi:hypothetical protein
MGEIEAQPIRINRRASLLAMVTEHLLQGAVEQMGGAMVGAHAPAPRTVDRLR